MMSALLPGLIGQADAAGVDEPIKPVSRHQEQDPARVELGRRLFHDVRLSVNDSTSCASCHHLDQGGADTRPFSVGFDGQRTEVNAPTVFNAGLNFRQFWDGRADSLEAQVDEVVRSPVEMGSTWAGILAKLAAEDHYRRAFEAAYVDGLTAANVQNAIASFERTLTTPDSRFDRFLEGDASALTVEEKAGYQKFKQYGCVACHQGVNIGGNMFQKFGVMEDYFKGQQRGRRADEGRFAVTGDEGDRHVFKVPSLRNVELTAPYFHDASAATLEEAVDVMFRYQLGRVASDGDKALIVRFLKTLTARPSEAPL
ncbi:cytochrome c peroxidase [Pseudomonas sp. LFM046]|uniref:cytochrome-c peroxidase n=1 Tax=Pseudomonas sp. LFM046 TaxID=1608357 RepID=UPI001F5C0A7C|nr:cytochrome c peroxidase [Pseudomonas sp. LFM046]